MDSFTILSKGSGRAWLGASTRAKLATESVRRGIRLLLLSERRGLFLDSFSRGERRKGWPRLAGIALAMVCKQRFRGGQNRPVGCELRAPAANHGVRRVSDECPCRGNLGQS